MKSPLHEAYRREGAMFAPIADYAVAATVAGATAEYEAIRGGIGITDRSDMAKFKVSGDGALAALERAFAGDIAHLPENAIRQTLLLNDRGGIVAEVQVYNMFEHYWVICERTAGGAVREQLAASADAVTIEDLTDTLAAIGVEGPYAWELPPALAGAGATGLPVMRFVECDIAGKTAIISRFGHTGEYGYVYFVPAEGAVNLLELMRRQSPKAVLCGRAVHELLRLEVRALCLELDCRRGETPLQAGLHWMIGFRKEAFVGRAAVLAELESGPPRKLIALKFEEPGSPREGGRVFAGDNEIGYVAHEGFSPRLNAGIALAYLDAEVAFVGLTFSVESDQGLRRAVSVSTPFFPTLSMSVRMT